MSIFDMLLTKAMMGEGGGESSDFSTAQVTIEIDALEEVRINMAHIYEDDESASTETTEFESGTYTVVLYKGHCHAVIEGHISEIFYTGNIDGTLSGCDIMGDGTITIIGQ